MIVDYWVVRRGNLHVLSLYQADSTSPYYYNHGFNFRAFAAWISGIVLVISGIAGAIKPRSISQVRNAFRLSLIAIFEEVLSDAGSFL
jgi:NCS1 family nucleobase:cation symporter-1